LNHFGNRVGDFIGHQIRDPNNSTLFLALRENLYRRVMVSERLTPGRPRVPASPIVDSDNQFTHDHSVAKRHGAPVTFEFTIDYKSRHQTFMNSAHVADCIPNKFFVPLNFNFFADNGHNVFLGSLIGIKDLSNWWAPQTTFNAGETMSDSGAIDQTGVVLPVSAPAPSSNGSLYKRIVNAPVQTSHFAI